LDPRVVEVLGRQFGGFQHSIELAALHHRDTMIDQ